jgi:sialic acid synthase SpsE
MIDGLKAIDTGKHEIIIKHQLFEKAGDNIPLDHLIFNEAFYYAKALGYKTTSSVFDLNSLRLLLDYDIPFVKIANRRDLDWLIGEVPRKIPVYVSIDNIAIDIELYTKNFKILCCVSEYPAKNELYEDYFPKVLLQDGISDHTIGLNLFKKYQPRIWEKHYKLFGSTGLDAGPFAITPEQLKEIL